MVLAKAHIGDYDQFWSVFSTAGAEHRRAFGSKGAQLFRNSKDPNQVVALFDWAKEDYERFLADPKTREIMGSAGLEGPPEHVFLEPTGKAES